MFAKLQERSQAHGESKDCTVKMAAQVLETSYEDAWNWAAKLGRKPRQGFHTHIMLKKFREMGLEISIKYTSAKTVKTLERMRLRGRFIVITSKHVLFHKNGRTYDWTSGRQHRIVEVWQVTGEANPDMINPTCNTLDMDYRTSRALSKPVRTRNTSVCWEVLHADSGEVIGKFKRKPTAKIKALRAGNLYSTRDRSAYLQIRSTVTGEVYNDGRRW